MSSFQQQLRRIRLLLRSGRLLAVTCSLIALAAALWLLFGVIDGFAAFESSARVIISSVLAGICAVAAFVGFFIALRVPAKVAADHADSVLSDPRRPASAALSLRPEGACSPLAGFLTDRSLESSATALASLPAGKIIPWRVVLISAAAVVLLAAITGILQLAAPGPFATISNRLLHPASDLPPHSPFVFVIDPAHPSTVYGGEILVTAHITGATPDKPVECIVRKRDGGKILRLPAFREASGRYSRKLDGLTEPVEIAFATGKARSTWHEVEILLEPEILSGKVRLTPPAYTGLQASEFPLDTNEIAALDGSSVTLELTSNRPLGSATLVFTPASLPGTEAIPKSIDGTLSSGSTASFTWTSTRSGRISATLRDVRGTPTPRPLDIAFRAMPDLQPVVGLSSPPGMMLATPRSKIPVAGRAEDDFSLARIRFIRTLAGFRDRAHVVAPSLNGKSFYFSETLDLEDLGLEAGQVVELMLDASDHNPSLLGQGSSEISRIQIISEDQYATYIRAKTTINQFAARFKAAKDAMTQAREALEKLDDAAKKQNGNPNPEALEKAAKEAAETLKKAAELLGKIADDFPAFELEKRLKDLAEAQAENLRQNAEALEKLDPKIGPEQLRKDIGEMLERLNLRQPELKQLDDDANKVNQASSLLEMAAKFRKIYEDQKSIAKRFGTIVEELRHGEDRNRRLLPSLAETQEKNRRALDEFKTELQRRAEALPADDENLAPLLDSALKFLDDLKTAAPETLMDAASAHGKAGQAGDAFSNAENARALLERLMSEPEPFPEAAMGKAPKFDVPQLDVNETLQQMLEGLLAQNPGEGQGDQQGQQGQGMGGMGGIGARGNPRDGFPMDLPVVGPDRLQFDQLASESGKGGGKDGKTGPSAPLPETAETGTLRPDATRKGQGGSPTPESIPESYRDAVKKFLTP